MTLYPIIRISRTSAKLHILVYIHNNLNSNDTHIPRTTFLVRFLAYVLFEVLKVENVFRE